jgi:hypothetical protein
MKKDKPMPNNDRPKTPVMSIEDRLRDVRAYIAQLNHEGKPIPAGAIALEIRWATQVETIIAKQST